MTKSEIDGLLNLSREAMIIDRENLEEYGVNSLLSHEIKRRCFPK